jgi:hypothetical protein
MQAKHDVKITSFLPNPGNKDNTWKDIIHRYSHKTSNSQHANL